MLIHDGATTLSRTRTPEGFLRVKARIGRAGLHDYKAGEIGGPLGTAPDRTVRVYRPPEDVFDPESLRSFAEKPVTLDHPPRMVDAANWKSVAVGHSGQEVVRDGDHVAADLTITDAAAVVRAEAGAQLSNGYWADFVFEPGVTSDGQAYDAVQRNIRGNHIALVDAGRCGSSCRIDAASDAAPPCGCEDASQAAQDRRGVVIEGLTVETDSAGAAALTKLQAVLDATRAENRRLVGMTDDAISVRAAVPDAAALDTLVADRAEVLDAASRLVGRRLDTGGLTTAAIRRLVVEMLIGPAKTRARGDDYVAAAFDALIAAHDAANPLAAQMSVNSGGAASSREAALAARDRYLNDAWKGESQLGV